MAVSSVNPFISCFPNMPVLTKQAGKLERSMWQRTECDLQATVSEKLIS